MYRFNCCVAVAVAGLGGHAGAGIINVPADQPTIQAAIDASLGGGHEVVVAPGTYNEVIDFMGKSITLRSSDGPELTIISGSGLNWTVVTCRFNHLFGSKAHEGARGPWLHGTFGIGSTESSRHGA